MRPVILFRPGLGEMDADELAAARRHFTCFRERTAIQRGDLIIARYSMLPFPDALQADADYADATLLNTLKMHRYAADLRNWVEDLRDLTPKTWYRLEEIDEAGPYILKGKTNSRKFDWRTHMFAKDRQAASEVEWRLSTDGLIGHGQQDIYIRKYVPLKTFMIGLNDLPITNEFRVFVAFGEILCGAYYWSNYITDLPQQPSFDQVPKSLLAEVIKRIGNKINFYTVDVAQTEQGEWIVIEVNDGTMSGLSENNPEMLYARLRDVVDAHYGQPTYAILVNGVRYDINTPRLAYEDIVRLAGLIPGRNYSCTFTMRRSHDVTEAFSGILIPGKSIDLRDGLCFSMYLTGNA